VGKIWVSQPPEPITAASISANAPGPSQSKLANLVYAAELARRYPQILSVSVHPGLVATDNINNMPGPKKALAYFVGFVTGTGAATPDHGALNILWAAGAKRSGIVNGAFYYPVGRLTNDKLDKIATSQEFANGLWQWTEDAIDGKLRT
jgi:NAD(P)-dependent dehydrogenase (short-subunit alcohol dehydrogenase family)